MFKEETLRTVDDHGRTFEEPDGEFVAFMGVNNNTISVLTRIDIEKGESGEEETAAPFAPEKLTVGEIQEQVHVEDYSGAEAQALLEAEQSGKDRKTAKREIKNELE